MTAAFRGMGWTLGMGAGLFFYFIIIIFSLDFEF